jgi:hypothetical protein
MKKLVALLLLTVSASTYAQHHHHGHGHWRHGHSNGWEWVVPAVIGGAIVYQVTRPPVVVQQPPVVVQSTGIPTVQQQTCSPWTEIQNVDGTITRTRTCTQ